MQPISINLKSGHHRGAEVTETLRVLCVSVVAFALRYPVMRRIAAILLVAGLTLVSCKKKVEAVAPPAEPTPTPAATTSSTATAPKTPIPSVTLATDAPIPGNGLALWLTGDDAMKSASSGKLASWTNPLVP